MSEGLVKKYYSEYGVKEWKRLVRDTYSSLEFETTKHFMQKHLPKEGLILDAGGGPGRYTIELAKMGYNVVLVDLSHEMLEIARKQIKIAKVQKKVVRIIQGSVDELGTFENKTFDAAICLGGPLSHIVEETRRERAIKELTRVSKEGSPVFFSVIGRIAVLIIELIRFPSEKEFLKILPKIRDTGNYYGGYGFAPCHFYQPEELEKALKKTGLEVLEMVGLEGLASGHRKETNRLARKFPEAWKIWWETHLKTCTHEASVGISEHFMAICRKP